MSESNQIFNPPKAIQIKEYTYSFKDELKNNFYSYRCKFRSACGITIKIHQKELDKIMNNKEGEIEYTISSTVKEHKCKKNINKEFKKEKIEQDINSRKILIRSLIKQNIDKDLSFHVTNLKSNNIILKKLSIKWLLQKYREEDYPSDEIFLKDISKIIITLEESPNMKNIPLCYNYTNIINMEKKNRLKKYVIFTSSFQIKNISKCTQIYIDGTFKLCPKGYYQIINIGGFLPYINGILPIFMIPITGKSEFVYNSIFNEVKKIIENFGITKKNIPSRFMLDFEASLQNAVRKNFPESKINGYFFHYVKLLWEKAKKLGLCKKNDIKYTKIIIFMLKIMPYMMYDERIELFNNLKDFFYNNEKGYERLLRYYEKNWLKNKYLDYAELTDEEYLNRTNNYIESFHQVLNKTLGVYHPKMSYLIFKYKDYLINTYNKLKESIINRK